MDALYTLSSYSTIFLVILLFFVLLKLHSLYDDLESYKREFALSIQPQLEHLNPETEELKREISEREMKEPVTAREGDLERRICFSG